MLDNTGVFVTDNLNNIVNPVTNETFVFLTTDGQLYVFNGSGYTVITGGGAGSGITTLTGNVTAGPGSGSQVATIANAAVTLAKIANAAANSKLLGSGASGSGSPYSELTLGTNLSMSGTTLNASGGGGSGALTLVEAQTLTAGNTDITFSGLDGNTDVMYRMLGVVKIGANATDVVLLVNGATTNMSALRVFNGGTDGTNALIGGASTGAYISFDIIFNCKANPNSQAFARYFIANSIITTNAPALAFMMNTAYQYNDTSTNITTLGIQANTAGGLANGSYVNLYKYSQA